MNSTTFCSECQGFVDPEPPYISCNLCGSTLPSQSNTEHEAIQQASNQNKQETEALYLEVLNMKAWYTASEHIAFKLRIHNAPKDTSTISAFFSGHLTQKKKSQKAIFRKEADANTYAADFQGSIPKQGGQIFLKMKIVCQTTTQIKHNYYGSFTIDAIAPHANQEEMIKQRINTTILNIKSGKGIVEIDGGHYGEINIDNADGITNLENLLRSEEKILTERVPLFLDNTETTSIFDKGKIIFHSPSKVKSTHLVARPEITLGRETEDTTLDIALKCFPENDENLRRINRISRKHCKIRQQQQIFEICDLSLWGTYLNNERLEKERWYKIAENDIIQIADINLTNQKMTGSLQLKVAFIEHALLLERLDNSPDEENYLIMMPDNKPKFPSTFEQPIFFHHQGSFYYYSETGQAKYLSPDQLLNIENIKFSFQGY